MADHGALDFVDRLRGAGVVVPLDRSLNFVNALGQFHQLTVDEAYWAGRATLLGRVEDIGTYDVAFTLFFSPGIGAGEPAERMVISRTIDRAFDVGDPLVDDQKDRPLDEPAPHDPSPDGEDEPDAEVERVVRYSVVDELRHRDFAELSDSELAELWAVLVWLRLAGARRRSSRLVAGRRGDRLDLRRTTRTAARHGGELIELARRGPGTRPRPLVLLIDVSGSMEPYARAMLRFAHAAVIGRSRVDVFAIGTRLTRLTRELHTADPDRALALSAAAVHDWSGGTRLGPGMRSFIDEWGQRGTARGATVVILSDGWDRGDPEELAEQMSRLSRLALRIVWVNPLKVSPGYAPLARGMAAALPYCDQFVEGHSLASLEALAELVAA